MVWQRIGTRSFAPIWARLIATKLVLVPYLPLARCCNCKCVQRDEQLLCSYSWSNRSLEALQNARAAQHCRKRPRCAARGTPQAALQPPIAVVRHRRASSASSGGRNQCVARLLTMLSLRAEGVFAARGPRSAEESSVRLVGDGARSSRSRRRRSSNNKKSSRRSRRRGHARPIPFVAGPGL